MTEQLYYVFRQDTDNHISIITRSETEANFWRKALGIVPTLEPWPLVATQLNEPDPHGPDPRTQTVRCHARTTNLTQLGHWQEYRPAAK